jgi:hypothetical protein
VKARSVTVVLGATLLALGCGACGTILGIEALDAGPGPDATAQDGMTADTTPLDSPGEETALRDSSAPDGTTSDGTPNDTGADGGDSSPMDSSSTDSPVTDSSTGGDAGPGDASFDSATLDGVPIASVGGGFFPLGNASQVHVIYAQNDQRVWVFYLADDSYSILTMTSSDLKTWTAGDPVVLSEPTSGFGNNFSLAYANLGNTDVVHLVVSEALPGDGGFFGETVHLRMAITGPAGAGHLGNPTMTSFIVNGEGNDIDGPATVVTSTGVVVDATGRDNDEPTQGDMDIWQSSLPDEGGTSWSSVFTQKGYYPVSGETSAHQLIALSEGGVVGAWADDGNESYSRVSWQQSFSGLWNADPTSPGSIFAILDGGASVTVDYNSWSLCRLTDTEIHAMAHVSVGSGAPTSFAHAIFDGTTWQTAPAPGDLTGDAFNGMVLVSDVDPTDGMLAVATSNNTSQLNVAKWIPGSPGSWTAWRTFTSTDPSFKWIAGSGCGNLRPSVFWVDTATQMFVGADVSGFLH